MGGLVTRGKQAGSAQVAERLAAAMPLHGRGGFAHWHAGGVSLCQQFGQAAFLPQSAPKQTVLAANGRVLVADVRLDGREALMRRLGVAGSEQGMVSDEQLLLSAFERWRERCVDHLLGDYAFAVWCQADQSLFCARDRLGLRPFYYRQSEGGFCFASSARAVATAGALPDQGRAGLNRARVADYLAGLEAIDEQVTFYDQVFRLPRGHYAIYRDGRLSLQSYWQASAEETLKLASDEAYLEAFTELFEQAVADRMTGPISVACTLSGGLDSASVSALGRDWMRAHGRGDLTTVSGVADDPAHCIESAFVEQVVTTGGLQALRVCPSEWGDEHRIEAEEPWDDMMTILACCYRAARDGGHGAVMDGLDGEMLCALPESYPAFLIRQARPLTAWREYRGQQRHYYRTDPRFTRFVGTAGRQLAPAWAKRAARGLLGAGPDTDDLESRLIAPDLAREVDLPGRIATEQAACATSPGADLRAACAERVMAPYCVAGVERYHRVAVQVGIEPRSPLLDIRLLDFCLSLPWHQKSRRGWSKFLLRRLAERRLTPAIAWREGWEHIGWDFNVARLKNDRERHLARLKNHRAELLGWVRAEPLDEVIALLQSTDQPLTENVRLLADLAAWLEREDLW